MSFWKSITCALATLAIVEGGYIFISAHRQTKHFKPVDEDSYIAFDSETGQLCTTFRPNLISKTPSGPSSSAASSVHIDLTPKTKDPFIEAMESAGGDLAKEHTEVEKRIGFIHSLPVCADIH